MRHLLLLCLLLAACSSNDAQPPAERPDQGHDMAAAPDSSPDQPAAAKVVLRVATYNTSLFGAQPGATARLLADPQAEHPRKVAAILQLIRPDIVLLNEFDYDEAGESARLLRENFLSKPQDGSDPLDYPYVYVAQSNTGEPSGYDLDKNGRVGGEVGTQDYGNDSFGFGIFPGQYAFVVLSRFPIDEAAVRTFRLMRWQDLPGHTQPSEFYGAEAAGAMRLSSKSHADIPITVAPGKVLHLLASHPTPPSFDGPEDRNGRRNRDEIAFWTKYISPDEASALTDDAGASGGLEQGASFVIAGDLNSDPLDGDSVHEGINGLLTHPRVQDTMPAGAGGQAAAERDGEANTTHQGNPALDTADFSDRSVGNLRVDYVLPSKNLNVIESGVFWPTPDSPNAALTTISDHHPVWVELEI